MMSLLERSASYRKRPGSLQVFDNRVNWEPLQPSEVSALFSKKIFMMRTDIF